MTLLDRLRIYPRPLRGDARGWLLKTLDGHEAHLPPALGENYVVMARPGQVRGGHFHPLAHEWFTLLQGRATLLLADPATGERAELALSMEAPVTVHVPAGVAHALRAEQAEDEPPMLLSAYSDRRYDPADTIAYSFP
jgi:dTDP-4-dehydrorhamnose 3,5-epimerase-like enzyme